MLWGSTPISDERRDERMGMVGVGVARVPLRLYR